MPSHGFAWILAVSGLGFLTSTLFAQSKNDAPPSINSALVVQNALYQGRQELAKGNAGRAVELLEANLHLINGNKDYLAVLRDAYWSLLKDLQRQGGEAEAKEVLRRLRILDPQAELPGLPVEAVAKGNEKKPAPDDPFQQTPILDRASNARVDDALKAFQSRNYAEAARLFAKANETDPSSIGEHQASWAYCRLYLVIQKLNDDEDPKSLKTLEQEVEQALALAKTQVQLTEFGLQVQQRLRDRLRSGVVRGAAPERVDSTDGWELTESANFRVLHRQKKEFAERVLAIAEETRTAQFEKWFGPAPSEWTPRCDVFVYGDAAEYAAATRQPAQSPGHSTVEFAEGKIRRRRLDVVGNNLNLLTSTVPHEVTHVVLADLFPDPQLPRWADEAMAILAEPRPQIDKYLRALPRCKQDGTLFGVHQLLPMNEFPESKRITAFYCQSVALVDMLVKEKDPRTFAMFLRTAQRYGYEKALERSYAIRSYAELQRKLSASIP